MKKNTQFSLFEIRRITILAITVAALLLGRPVFAGGSIFTIDITENSSTSLTLLLNGVNITMSAVMLTSPDNWTLTFPSTVQFGVFNNGWAEPMEGGGATAANILIGQGTSQLFLISDGMFASTIFANGSTHPLFGSVGGVGTQFNTTIHDDNGDGPVGVPESGSTLALLFLSLTALLGATRLHCARFA